jgi:hypothetical protein
MWWQLLISSELNWNSKYFLFFISYHHQSNTIQEKEKFSLFKIKFLSSLRAILKWDENCVLFIKLFRSKHFWNLFFILFSSNYCVPVQCLSLRWCGVVVSEFVKSSDLENKKSEKRNENKMKKLCLHLNSEWWLHFIESKFLWLRVN